MCVLEHRIPFISRSGTYTNLKAWVMKYKCAWRVGHHIYCCELETQRNPRWLQPRRFTLRNRDWERRITRICARNKSGSSAVVAFALPLCTVRHPYHHSRFRALPSSGHHGGSFVSKGGAVFLCCFRFVVFVFYTRSVLRPEVKCINYRFCNVFFEGQNWRWKLRYVR